jgi:hypothetical protein
MTYKSFLPPALVIFNNKQYVMPGYHEVPLSTTLKEVTLNWHQILAKPAPEQNCSTEDIITYLEGNWVLKLINNNVPDIYETVESNRTYKIYDVIRMHGKWSCTCKGFTFKGRCKHVEEMKLKYE